MFRQNSAESKGITLKKYVWVPLLALALFVSGCAKEITPETTTATTIETTAPETVAVTVPETTAPYDISNLAAYLASVKEESDNIKYYLEFEAMSQGDMNSKSLELYELWDGALNYLWGELKACLPEEEFASLLDEQRAWISDKEAAIAEAGQEVEGGSMYPLVINSVGTQWTEERVWQLYALLQ